MCNLPWTPHSNLEKDNSLNHSCVSPKLGCLEYTNFCLQLSWFIVVVEISLTDIYDRAFITRLTSLWCDWAVVYSFIQ